MHQQQIDKLENEIKVAAAAAAAVAAAAVASSSAVAVTGASNCRRPDSFTHSFIHLFVCLTLSLEK